MPEFDPVIIEQLLPYLGLILLAAVAIAVGWLWCSTVAFRLNPLYGLGVLLIPLVTVYFMVTQRNRGKIPTMVLLGGIAVAVGTLMLGNNKLERIVFLDTRHTLDESCQDNGTCQDAVTQYVARCFEDHYHWQTPDIDYGVPVSKCVTTMAKKDGLVSPENVSAFPREQKAHEAMQAIEAAAEEKQRKKAQEPEVEVVRKVAPPSSTEILNNLNKFKGSYINVRTMTRNLSGVYIHNVQTNQFEVRKYYSTGFVSHVIKTWRVRQIEIASPPAIDAS